MIIHTIQQGETIFSIANKYKVPPSQIISDNELKNPDNITVGQTIVILYPDIVHIVQPNQTLSSIALEYDTSVIRLLQNNPQITDADSINVGDRIIISYEGEKYGEFSVIGYSYPNINTDTLKKTLPYLTYLTLFTYGFTPEGDLIEIEDTQIIETSRQFNTAPLMLLSTLTNSGGFSNKLASEILNNKQAQENLINNILANIRYKNYYGLDIDFEYVLPQDREAYVNFVENTTIKLNEEGYPVFVALAPKISADQEGLLYEAHDYYNLGRVANNVLLMTYEWGYTYGPPMAVAPLNKVKEVLDYAVTEIPVNKIFMGIPNYGYDWTLPFEKGDRARSLSNVAAVELAVKTGSEIQYDETAQSPFFNYYDDNGNEHVVWFEDARSINAKLELANSYNLKGIGYWNIMKYFPQNWLVLNSKFDITKLY